MVFPAAAALIAIAATLSGVGLGRFTCEQCGKNEMSLKRDGQEIARIPLVEELRVYNFIQSFVKRVSTTNTKRQNADFKFDNPQGRDIRVSSLSILPDPSFKSKGAAEIRVNGRTILSLKGGDMADIAGSLNVAIPEGGMKFQESKAIEVFVWNDVDATAIALTIAGLVGDY